jgi:hypothetical protein
MPGPTGNSRPGQSVDVPLHQVADPGLPVVEEGPRHGPNPAPLADPGPVLGHHRHVEHPQPDVEGRAGTAADDDDIADPGQPAENRQQRGSRYGLLRRRPDGV